MKNIILVGSTTIDEIRIAGHVTIKPGGVPVYAGLTWLEQGIMPMIVSNVACRDTLLHDFFEAHGLMLLTEKSATSTRFINAYQGDNREQSVPGVAKPISRALLKASLNLAHHLHFGPLHPNDIHPSVYGMEINNKIITCDVQGLTRRIAEQKVTREVSPQIDNLLRLSHIAKADESELTAILDYLRMDVYECLRRFHIHEIVMTRAGQGGVVYQEHKEIPYEACPKNQIVDTTGAGDVFFAAYLYARIYQHQAVSTACQYAACLTASHIEGVYLRNFFSAF